VIPGIDKHPHLQAQFNMELAKMGAGCRNCDKTALIRKFAHLVQKANKRYLHDRRKKPGTRR